MRTAWLLGATVVLVLAGCSADGMPAPVRDSAVPPADTAPPIDSRPPPPVDTGPADTNMCGELVTCGDACVDTDVRLDHCGGCDNACPTPANSVPSCLTGSCAFRCLAGFVVDGDTCVEAPRQIRPPSLSNVASHQPRFTWVLPSGVTDATLDICTDPSCGTVFFTVDVTGENHVLETPLEAGRYHWRVTAGGRSSKIWQFWVGFGTSTRLGAWGAAPDYDRDGTGDVIIGAPKVDDDAGRIYVFYGSDTGPTASPDIILRAPDPGEFGQASACAADVNGDGHADLLVGAPRFGDSLGRAYLYYGTPRGLRADPDVVLEPPDGDLFGSSVAGLGDVDGDGYSDIAVGAPGQGVTVGRVHVYYGSATGIPTTPRETMLAGGRFATSVGAIGDVNGDGFADMGVGAPNAGTNDGAAHIFYGAGDGFADMADLIIEGTEDAGELGFAIASAGDVNADGFADVLIGAPAVDSSRGRAYVHHGAVDGLSATPTLTIAGLSSAGGRFGHSLAGWGDPSGDGYGDIAVGAFGVMSRTGRLLIYLGSDTGINPSATALIDSPSGTNSDFAWSISGIADTDGNGVPDLLVGAPGISDGSGRAFVYRGANGALGITNTPLVTLNGPSGGRFGRSVATAAQ